MQRSRRLGFRLLLLIGGSLFAVLMGEVTFRTLHREPSQGQAWFAVDGPKVPPFELIYFMSSWPWMAQRQSLLQPRGWLPPGFQYRLGYENAKWDYFDKDGAVTYRINSLGFRDLEFSVTKQPDEWRVLTLGDSFTMGWGVQLEGSWPQQLEQLLRKGRTGPCEVINGGFATLSFTVGNADRWVALEGLRFKPDVVIIGFCLNDCGQIPMLSYPKVPNEAVLGSELLGELVHATKLRAAFSEQRDMSLIVKADPGIWNETQAGLQRLHTLLETNGIPMLVAILPMLSELGPKYPYAELHKMLRSFCATEHIHCLDLLPQFDGLDERSLWVHETDQHPNEKGTRVIASGIAAWLAESKLAGR